MADLLVIAMAGVITYAMRASFIAVLGTAAAPPRLERVLRQVKPAVLAALVATSVVGGHGGGPVMPVALAMCAAAVAARKAGPITVLSVGMAVLWASTAVW